MSGFFTPGIPQASSANLSDGSPQIPVDTNLGQGIAPQSVKANPVQLAAAGNVNSAITYGANISLDASLYGAFSMTFGAGNATLTLSNMLAGQTVYGYLTQDGVGSRTLTVAAGSGGATVVSGTPLTATAGASDLIAIRNIGSQSAPIYAVYPVAKNFV